ncbi:TylF/MycF family methyltransferase [Saccharopolyspora shandongensis]|uniref:TylF/MycF family methyltransferase n=1 Tax=Saccharopolyspora shandongensis TaxID=418495 RepID=UPI00343441CD
MAGALNLQAPQRDAGAELYLDLLKKVLTNVIYEDAPNGRWQGERPYDAGARAEGQDWPSAAHTMVGLKRLDHLHRCLDRIRADDVPGDLIETGVWRGGVCIFMRAFLKAHRDHDRVVWVADSFQGIPTTMPESHPADRELALHEYNDVLAVPKSTVEDNFRCYGLLDDQVGFLAGWFRDTLPDAPIERLALLRLDGDLYESTENTLNHLYDKLSPGGFVIVDDYAIPACRDAVDDFRARHGITEPIEVIDTTGVCWRRVHRRPPIRRKR